MFSVDLCVHYNLCQLLPVVAQELLLESDV